MQELIDWTIYQGSKRTVPEKEIIDMAKILLEKEKEQIEEARLNGYGEGYLEGIYDAENK